MTTIQKNKSSNFILKVLIGLAALLLVVGTQAQSDLSPTDQYREAIVELEPFDTSAWRAAKSGIDYSKELVRKKQEKKDTTPKNQFNLSSEVKKTIARVMLLLLVIGLVILVLWFTLGEGRNISNKKFNQSSKLAVSVEELEENLQQNDPTNLIKAAIALGDYRLAIRLYYLKVIRQLSLNGHITWERRKTNRTYLNELESTELKTAFRAATSVFERVWYGNREIKNTDFKAIEPQFQQLLNAISERE